MSAAIIQHHREAELKLRRIRKALGWEPGDPPFDEALAIDMRESMRIDAQRRAELLEQHLRAVLEIARTWQPDYATKMDRDTLQHAQDCADGKRHNASMSGPQRPAQE